MYQVTVVITLVTYSVRRKRLYKGQKRGRKVSILTNFHLVDDCTLMMQKMLNYELGYFDIK